MAEANNDLVARLGKVAAELKMVSKDGVNSGQKYRFMSIDDVTNTLHPLLAKHQVTVTPQVQDYEVSTLQGRNSTQRLVTGVVQFIFHGPKGDKIVASVLAEGADTGDKAASKMMTQAFKKALTQVFTIPTGEPDPDAFAPTVEQLAQTNENRKTIMRLAKELGLDEQQLAASCRWASTNTQKRPASTVEGLGPEAITKLLEYMHSKLAQPQDVAGGEEGPQ